MRNICLRAIAVLFSVVSGAIPPLSVDERLAFIKYVKAAEDGDLSTVMRKLRQEIPTTHWTVSRLDHYRKRMYYGSYVPDWLHRLLSSLPVSADPRDPGVFEYIQQSVPQDASPRFREPGVLEFVSVVWLGLCINPMRANERFNVCDFRTEGDFQGHWTLNRNQIPYYLDLVAMREAGAWDLKTRFSFSFDSVN